jgi:hypothetical protein
VGIDDLSDSNPLTIYPNPAKDVTNFYFRLNGPSKVKLSVVNTMGQVVAKEDLVSFQPAISNSVTVLATSLPERITLPLVLKIAAA